MICMVSDFPGMVRMSSRQARAPASVCFPSSISRESWFTAATRFKWVPLTGMCCTLAKYCSPIRPAVAKMPLLRTNASPQSTP